MTDSAIRDTLLVSSVFFVGCMVVLYAIDSYIRRRDRRPI